MFVKRAAILYLNGGIFEGSNYGAISSLARKMGVTGSYIYGYTDSNDNFMDSRQALEIAKEAGQVPSDFTGPLYPEDIFAISEVDNAID